MLKEISSFIITLSISLAIGSFTYMCVFIGMEKQLEIKNKLSISHTSFEVGKTFKMDGVRFLVTRIEGNKIKVTEIQDEGE